MDSFVLKNILLQMNNTLSRRGPDEEGNFIDKHVALAHKRLIVIDPNGGKQPMPGFGRNGQRQSSNIFQSLLCFFRNV